MNFNTSLDFRIMKSKNYLNLRQSLINQIPKQTKYKTFGYIRRQEKKLNLPAIPQLIMHKCLLFSKDEDYFSTHNGNSPLQLTDKKQTLTLITQGLISCCSYRGRLYRSVGTVSINNASKIIATWKLKINNISNNNHQHPLSMMLGLINTEKSIFFGIWNCGKVWTNIDFHDCKKTKWIDAFRQNDEISIILDLYNKEIRYKLNNQCEKCLLYFKTKALKPTNYKFCAEFRDSPNSISIINFSIYYQK